MILKLGEGISAFFIKHFTEVLPKNVQLLMNQTRTNRESGFTFFISLYVNGNGFREP